MLYNIYLCCKRKYTKLFRNPFSSFWKNHSIQAELYTFHGSDVSSVEAVY